MIYIFVSIVFCWVAANLQICCEDSCQTPDRTDGRCVDIRDCRSISVNLITKIEPPLAAKVKRKLEAYKCGEPYRVCCPAKTVVLDPQLFYHNRDVAPDVTNHKNINLLPERCGLLNPDAEMFDTGNASLNEFPFMALLKYKTEKGMEFLCGGTIINKNYILTAAHCLDYTNAELVAVRIGEYSIKNEVDCEVHGYFQRYKKCNPPVQDLKVEKTIVHPQYEADVNISPNDIALLSVPTINLTDKIYPVCLPVGKYKDETLHVVQMIGWGISNRFTGEKADVLQKVGLPKADRENCSVSYSESRVKLTNTQFCAGGRYNDAHCSGDSGGPMLASTQEGDKYVQHGVISFGPRLCYIRHHPGVSTLVKFYMDWILDNMKP